MRKTFRDLPQWVFDIDEVSYGVHEVIAKDTLGHSVTAKGVDAEALIDECTNHAMKISQNK